MAVPSALPVKPLRLMVRFALPGSLGRVHEFGLEANRLANETDLGWIEGSKLTRHARVPVGAFSTAFKLNSDFYGEPVRQALDGLYANVAALQLDPARASDPSARLGAMQMRISVVGTPVDAPVSWTFDMRSAPAGVAAALDSATNLINLTSWGGQRDRRAWATAPNWEALHGFVPSNPRPPADPAPVPGTPSRPPSSGEPPAGEPGAPSKPPSSGNPPASGDPAPGISS
jgi:hypothetical protein